MARMAMLMPCTIAAPGSIGHRRSRQFAWPDAPVRSRSRGAGMLSFVSREPKEVPTPSPLPPALARWLRARDVDAAALLQRCELPPALETADEWPVGPRTVEELLAAAAALTGEPNLGLRLPGELGLRKYGLHELVAQAAPTVGAGLAGICKYASLIHPRLELRLD